MGIPLDPTAVTLYALIYMATIAVIVLLLLPILITMLVLLLAGGVIQGVVLLVKIAAAGLVRGVVGLFRGSGGRQRSRSRRGRLVPH